MGDLFSYVGLGALVVGVLWVCAFLHPVTKPYAKWIAAIAGAVSISIVAVMTRQKWAVHAAGVRAQDAKAKLLDEQGEALKKLAAATEEGRKRNDLLDQANNLRIYRNQVAEERQRKLDELAEHLSLSDVELVEKDNRERKSGS